MSRHTWVALVAVAVLLAACASGPSPVASGVGGISGIALAGPTCPVERPGDPACAPRPIAGATILIQDATGADVATIVTDAAGRFQVALPPGAYTVVGQPVEGLMGNPAPLDVEVAASDVTVELSYDTGIR
jgi:Carboxypeptidase regulatory-like domain